MDAPRAAGAGGGDHELDLPALRQSLAQLERRVQEAQARVLTTIEAKHTEFVEASAQVVDLRESVSSLRSDLKDAAAAVAGAGAESPGPRLQAAMAEHRAVKEELVALDAAAAVLTTMLQAQKQLTELDALIGAARYTEGAELTLEIARALQSISARDARSEPALVVAMKQQYYQRRILLVSRLEDALAHLISMTDGPMIVARYSVTTVQEGADSKCAARATTLSQVWDALGVLDLRARRVDQLADQAHARILRPLLDAGRRLPFGQVLQAQASSDEGQACVRWRWLEVQGDGKGIENVSPERNAPRASGKGKLRPVQCVLPALKSFFDFARQHWAGESPEVLADLGKRLWQPVARSLVQHFDLCGDEGGDALERLEASMLDSGVIKSTEKTLSRHVHQHRHTLGEQRRARVLDEAREWLLQDNGTLVEVSDASEPGSVSQLLGDDVGKEAQSPPEVADRFVSERLRHALGQDTGLLRLPAMSVSRAARQLVGRLRELMEETVQAAESGRAEIAGDLSKLMRELCALFAVLRPYSQRGQLKTDARCCAVFLTDCLYLVHVLTLMPFTYGGRLRQEQRQLTFFVDLVPQLRRLGESHFFAMLQHHQAQLDAALRPCDLGPGISRDKAWNAAEAALGAAVQQAKLATQGLMAALPAPLLKEITGLLVGVVCQNLLAKLWAQRHMAPPDVSNVTQLFTTALAMCRQIFAGIGLEVGLQGAGAGDEAFEAAVPGWAALVVAAELLGSDFSRFWERRAQVAKALRREEGLRLMQLSFTDEQISPEDAWTMFAGGGGDGGE